MRSLSHLQFATLRFIDSHDVRESHLRQYKDTTLYYPLFKARRYIASSGEGDDPLIVLTQDGQEALASYERGVPPERLRASEMTDRTWRLLSAARRRLRGAA